MAKDSIDFVIIAADNVGVKSLHVDGKSCEPLEGTFAERSLLQGNTKKYRATVRALEGKKQVTIRAQDADGNVTTKDILLKHSPQLAEKQADFYEHGIAVVIGINKYTLWPSLEFSVSDAEALKEKLQIMGFHRII
ncbi:MAG: caspase family protein, partial [Deltaproteobacteria bacterium]|nr:caspase family protein [Deltaproteobacteria bacterium]